MPFFDPIRIGSSGTTADFTVDRSLRFNHDDDPYLSFTPSSTGNRKVWTFSAWIKRTEVNNRHSYIYTANSGGSAYFALYFRYDQLYSYFDPGNNYGAVSDREFRDLGAWFHLVHQVDAENTTQRIWINNEEMTLNSSRNPSNSNFPINTSGLPIVIGKHSWGTTKFSSMYLAEVHHCDGTKYTPSDFAESNTTTGQWIPKLPSVTYGTNGFYLKFADNSGTSATTLGKDSSGNSNNFTPNNFSVAAGESNDSLADTPTNNFCTMNPLVPSPSVTWANGNLDLAGSSSSEYNQTNTSTFGVSSGKWYVEVKYTNDGTTNTYVGICPITTSATTNLTNNVTDGAVLRMDNTLFIEGSSPSSGTSISSGDTIGIALDMDNQKVWFSVQGTYLSSGNPATGANATFDGITAGETIAICARPLSGTLNFNFGQRAYSYTAPTGFQTLCSANLPDPTILLPNKHFAAFTYTGTGSSGDVVNITNSDVDFTPDWVWVKTRTVTNDHILSDSVRGGSKYLVSSETYAEQTDTDKIRAFIQNGFESGTDGDTNWPSRTFVAWNWNAGDTDSKTYTVKVVDDSGNKYRFDDFGTSAVTLDLAEGGTYVFDWSDSSAQSHPIRFSTTSDGTHGGGSEYTTGVVKDDSAYKTTITIAASAPTLYYYCQNHSGMGGQVNTNSTLGSSNFDGSVQSVAKVNATAGFSIVNYVGTGQDNTDVSIGHSIGVAPQVVIVKNRDSAKRWQVFHNKLTSGRNIVLNSTNAESSYTSYIKQVSSTTFTVRDVDSNGNANVNKSSDNYIAYCFSGVSSYSKFGSYTGNGSSDGTFVFTGFRPALVIFKNSTSTEAWSMFDNKRDPDNPVEKFLRPSGSNADTSGSNDIDFLSNGFKARTSNNPNSSGATYIYLAFAESPFKNARAR